MSWNGTIMQCDVIYCDLYISTVSNATEYNFYDVLIVELTVLLLHYAVVMFDLMWVMWSMQFFPQLFFIKEMFT